MKTTPVKSDVGQRFFAELCDLLRRYGAELSADDHYQGYAECGEDVRMTVDIPAIYDADGNRLRDYCEVDLGRWLDGHANTCSHEEDP